LFETKLSFLLYILNKLYIKLDYIQYLVLSHVVDSIATLKRNYNKHILKESLNGIKNV